MLKVGLVGAGFIGTIHAFSLQLLRDAALVDAGLASVFDPDHERADRLCRYHGGEPAEHLDELLDAVDAVVCAPWTAAHEPVVAAVAERGLPVLCEKPLGRDLAESTRVAQLLDRVPHRVGLVLRASPMMARFEEEIRSGAHGAVLAVVLRDDQYFPDHGIYGSAWRADPGRAGGGTLLEHSIHDVDLLARLLGPERAVTASIAARSGRAVEDVASLLVEYGDGTSAQLASVWHDVDGRESSRHLEVCCERALLVTDDDVVGSLVIHTSAGTEVVEVTAPRWCEMLALDPEHVGGLSAYLGQMRSFVEGPATGGPSVAPNAATALAAHRVVDAAYRSGRLGERIPLPGW